MNWSRGGKKAGSCGVEIQDIRPRVGPDRVDTAGRRGRGVVMVSEHSSDNSPHCRTGWLHEWSTRGTVALRRMRSGRVIVRTSFAECSSLPLQNGLLGLAFGLDPREDRQS
jgi:hypothetical protein